MKILRRRYGCECIFGEVVTFICLDFMYIKITLWYRQRRMSCKSYMLTCKRDGTGTSHGNWSCFLAVFMVTKKWLSFPHYKYSVVTVTLFYWDNFNRLVFWMCNWNCPIWGSCSPLFLLWDVVSPYLELTAFTELWFPGCGICKAAVWTPSLTSCCPTW